MHRLQDGKAHQCGGEDRDDLAHVGGQQELDGLADVVVDTAALLHRAHNGGKVVVRQHHIRHIFGDVSAGDAHTHADIGGFDRGRVIDAVAGHGGDVTGIAPCVDDAGLMLRLYPGVHSNMGELLFKFGVVHGAELSAGNGLQSVGQNAQLLGDGHGGVNVVAGDHDGADPRLAALLNGGLDLRTYRVDHAGQSQEAQVMLQIAGFKGNRTCIIGPLGRSQHTQGTVGHGLVGRQNLSTLLLRHRTDNTAVPIAGAALQHHVGSALGELDAAAGSLVDGGHHLPAGVKGCLPDPGHLRLQLRLGQAALGAPCHQRRLGRLAVDIAALGQSGVRTQGHGGGGAVAVAAVIVHHGHFVLGQGAGLIRADDLGTAQRLHSGQAADNGAALGHIGNADAQHHCHHGGKALGDGGHRQ